MTYLHFIPKSKQAYIHRVGNLCNLARPFGRYCKLFSAKVAVIFRKNNFSLFSPHTKGMYVLKRRMTILIGAKTFPCFCFFPELSENQTQKERANHRADKNEAFLILVTNQKWRCIELYQISHFDIPEPTTEIGVRD